jgi:hypothetical protein
MKDVLIIRTRVLLKPEEMYRLRQGILEQIESGVVVLPAYYEAELVHVPDDIEVIVELENDILEEK